MKDAVVDQIEAVRKDNNVLWMGILRVALDKAPDETKQLLAKIRKNDMKISSLVGMLANDGN